MEKETLEFWPSSLIDFLSKETPTFHITILRHPLITANMQDRLESVLPDLQSTIYERKAPLESAPAKTDCLTSVHYLFLKAFNMNIPVTWVGDMPRLLVTSGWNFLTIDSSELKTGDLMFLKRKTTPGLIVHVALALDSHRIFHCKRNEGAAIESVEKVFQVFEQTIKEEQLRYIDRRNTDLRAVHGIYLRSAAFFRPLA